MRTLLIVILLLGAAAGCDQPDPGAGNAIGRFYAGPGSEWTAQLDTDGRFRLLHFPVLGQVTADQLINGTYASTASGFSALGVTTSAGSAVPAAGAQSFALEIADTLLTVASFLPGGTVVPMVPRGGCPGSAIASNVVKIEAAVDWSATDSDSSGTYTFDPMSEVALLPTRYSLTNPQSALPDGELTLGAGACADGIVLPSGGAELFESATGLALLHTQPALETSHEDEIYFALPQPATPLAVTDLAGSYIGFLSRHDAVASTVPVAIELSAVSNGVAGSATQLTDLNAGILGAVGANLTIGQIGAAPGLFNGTIATTASSSPSGGAVAQPMTCEGQVPGSAASSIMVCAGQDQAGAFVSLILVSKI